MNNFDLLKAVQPEQGWFTVLGIKGKTRVKQQLVATREEVDVLTQQLVSEGRNVFFSVAKFKTGDNRTKDNVGLLKAFWLDIDCGVDKAEVNEKTGFPGGYATQADGIAALRAFCHTLGLPKPIVVNSGRGLHVYWALKQEVTREEWEPVAKRFHDLCNTHGFYIDNSVFEVSRVLRIPGTYNFKDNPPTQVEVMSIAEPVEFSYFCEVLGYEKEEVRVAKPRRPLTALGKAMQGNVDSKFSVIMVRSGKGKGCATTTTRQ